MSRDLDFSTPESTAVSDLELPFPDVPLIVHELLLQAKRLADEGAPTEVIDPVLDQIAALREGRY